eukprot:gb/GFBE01053141.1/.p1 GENE.gb/GFBE01053141.1/~~gb/GFBE01053141.1/.p1  ORF type:complete len:297 (+),score=63.35 gb/GFBE01053141.1/:1-891(+)
MICEAANALGENFFGMWIILTIFGIATAVIMSGITFARLYWKPTFEQWQYKSNPKYPKPEHVRTEVLLTLKCIALSTIFPALSLYLAAQGRSEAFCGWGGKSLFWHMGSMVALVFGIDFFEWAYHYAGHQVPALWKGHKSHHRFFNPTPFSVIADEAVDQLIRSAPMLISVVCPINMDLMFGMFAVFFYGYGIYLHCGYELEWPDAHHPVINSSFQHFLHHAEGAVGKPRHTGFFIKTWDQLLGGDNTADMLKSGKCPCAKCSRGRGERSFEAWQKVEKVDYSCLLQPKFWLEAFA